MKDELHRMAELLATPIDFEKLAADGVLRKNGAWYEILDWQHLPEHAKARIQEVKMPNLVQFGSQTKKPLGLDNS